MQCSCSLLTEITWSTNNGLHKSTFSCRFSIVYNWNINLHFKLKRHTLSTDERWRIIEMGNGKA